MLGLRQFFCKADKSVLVKTCVATISRNFSSKPDLVSVSMQDGIATVSMNRHPVNGLNLDMNKALIKTIEDLSDAKAKGMILTSALPTIFSGGLDIMEMYKPEQQRLRDFWTSVQDLWTALYSTPFPTVAAITGHSPAGGCLLSLSCEYRVMVDNFTIGLNETQLGLIAPPWFLESMRAVIGNRFTELSLTSGQLYKSSEALKIGLVDEVVANRDEALAQAHKFMARFKRVNPTARIMTKNMIRQEIIDKTLNDREADLNIFLSAINNPKVQKGLEVYLEGLKKKA